MPRRDRRGRVCDRVREQISALLDGEDDSELAPVDACHLLACPECGQFQQLVPALNRQLRVSALQPLPDLTESILEQLVPLRAPRRRDRAPLLARWAAVAVPIGLALSGLTSGSFAPPRVQPTHPVTRCTALLNRNEERVLPRS